MKGFLVIALFILAVPGISQEISRGSGTVEYGLSDRSILDTPRMIKKSSEPGTVVLELCVDRSGKVVSTVYIPAGSTTSNPELIRMARANARHWKFEVGEVDNQCGTVLFVFEGP